VKIAVRVSSAVEGARERQGEAHPRRRPPVRDAYVDQGGNVVIDVDNGAELPAAMVFCCSDRNGADARPFLPRAPLIVRMMRPIPGFLNHLRMAVTRHNPCSGSRNGPAAG
jgi:hypothetical protein